jgi:hypothetical protein
MEHMKFAEWFDGACGHKQKYHMRLDVYKYHL